MALERRRTRGGIRRERQGWKAYVRLHAGSGGLRTRRFTLDTERPKIQAWIDDTWRDYRKKHPHGQPGTLAGDVPRYLKLLVNRPQLQKERTGQLAWWCDQFGDRMRTSLDPVELETALNQLLAAGAAASTVRHYRTALFHLFTKLDGKNAWNPLRDVTPPRSEDPMPRAIPYEIIDAIFDAMPEERHQPKLTAAQVDTIRRHGADPKCNRSALARSFGISEALVRKIVHNRRKGSENTPAKNRVRLQMMAYVGIPPAQLMRIDPRTDFNLDEPSVLVHGRKKGGGTRPTRLPLTPRGVQVCKGFIAVGASGKFSMSSARKTFLRAIRTMCRRLEEKDETRAIGEQLSAQLKAFGARPYDLRHSYLTEAQLAGGNLHATQALAMHTDIRQTMRYTLAAVSPQMKAVADQLAERRAGRLPSVVGNFGVTSDGEKGTKRGKNVEFLPGVNIVDLPASKQRKA